MSDKIKAKDLSYDSTLPPFLQRLRGQHTGNGDPDRHERAIARPKRAHDSNEDDGPMVVLESGETMSQRDFEKQAAATADTNKSAAVEHPTDGTGNAEQEVQPRRVEQNVSDGVTSKKRKAAKIVSADAEESSPPVDELNVSTPAKKVKKKTKPIKLAFEDDGD